MHYVHFASGCQCSFSLIDQVIVLWTANTERFCEVAAGLNDTADNLLHSIRSNAEEVSPSTLFAIASIMEGVSKPHLVM